MKKALIITLLAFFSVICAGQSKGCLKFLGIPIDGTEGQFAAKLVMKGFSYNSTYNSYKGQFNGNNVNVFIHTNHNLVDRVYVAFPNTTEQDVKYAFNSLLRQFNDNSKYLDLSMNSEIPSDEDISYEIIVHNKRYQASFSYFDPDRDPIAYMYALLDKLKEFFTPEQLAELKAKCKTIWDASGGNFNEYEAKMSAEIQGMNLSQSGSFDEEKSYRFLLTLMNGMKDLADGDVWFMIHEHGGEYNLGLYYDNLHNLAHGEDL